MIGRRAQQQPPITDTPMSRSASAYSAKYSGVAGYITRPANRFRETRVRHRPIAAHRLRGVHNRATRAICDGPPLQLTPITSAPAATNECSHFTRRIAQKGAIIARERHRSDYRNAGSTARAALTACSISYRSVNVSSKITSTPAPIRAAICSRNASNA